MSTDNTVSTTACSLDGVNLVADVYPLETKLPKTEARCEVTLDASPIDNNKAGDCQTGTELEAVDGHVREQPLAHTESVDTTVNPETHMTEPKRPFSKKEGREWYRREMEKAREWLNELTPASEPDLPTAGLSTKTVISKSDEKVVTEKSARKNVKRKAEKSPPTPQIIPYTRLPKKSRLEKYSNEAIMARWTSMIKPPAACGTSFKVTVPERRETVSPDEEGDTKDASEAAEASKSVYEESTAKGEGNIAAVNEAPTGIQEAGKKED